MGAVGGLPPAPLRSRLRRTSNPGQAPGVAAQEGGAQPGSPQAPGGLAAGGKVDQAILQVGPATGQVGWQGGPGDPAVWGLLIVWGLLFI